LTIAPPLPAIWSANADARASGPNRLVSNSARSFEESRSSTDAPRTMPALLINTVTSRAASAAAVTDLASVTSRVSAVTRGSVVSI
jgi:hypothetical protein